MKKLEEIEWNLKEIWKEYRRSLESEKEEEQLKAPELLAQYKQLHQYYKREKELQK